ncbi:MAG: transposase [Gammaproteobacteria bacterium]|nr:MAG: transposase [Gammaproteobacteria bacterium]
MPRQLRYKLPGVPQHVVQRGNNRQVTFFDDSDYVRYLEDLLEASEKCECDIHAYVLMTNHVHLLMTPQREDSIAKVMQSVGRKYVRYINGTYKRSGTLWEGRYKASVVQDNRYLLQCYRYIELNPVRAGMVESPIDYHWSSYAFNAFGQVNELIKPHEQYVALGRNEADRQLAYRELFRNKMDNALLHEIRETTQQCRVLGNERFRNEIEAALQIKATPVTRGRPRKQSSEIT